MEIFVIMSTIWRVDRTFWFFRYHNDRMINYDSDRGVSVKNDNFGSTLSIANATPAASGNYTCSPYNIRPSHVIVHVLNEGNSAEAVQNVKGEESEGSPPPSAAVQSNAGHKNMWTLSLVLVVMSVALVIS